MLDNLALAELACRAINLSERLVIAEKLTSENALEACTTQLNPLDVWTVNKLASKLAATQVKQQLYQQLATQIPTKHNLEKLLTDYKLSERNLTNLSELHRAEFIHHATWLNVNTTRISEN